MEKFSMNLPTCINDSGNFNIDSCDRIEQSEKIALLKLSIGKVARNRLKNSEVKTFSSYKKESTSWKSKNISSNRKKFQQCIRHNYESASTFMSRLYIHANKCKFIDIDERIQDQLLFGINNAAIETELKNRKLMPNKQIRAVYKQTSGEIEQPLEFINDEFNVILLFIIDSESHVNFINKNSLKKFKNVPIIPSNNILLSADGTKLKFYETVVYLINGLDSMKCYVTNTQNIIGCPDAIGLKLININRSIKNKNFDSNNYVNSVISMYPDTNITKHKANHNLRIKNLTHHNSNYIPNLPINEKHLPLFKQRPKRTQETFKITRLHLVISWGEGKLNSIDEMNHLSNKIHPFAMLSNYETHRYGRQIILKDFGPQSQQKLKKSSVCIVGCGGLGTSAASILAGAGIGDKFCFFFIIYI
ncbi:hypothetical protein A3Q56_06070 [Intoshia linei]|uniref:THIF-type NAD/FAD binding fold domain-containing protein n=1 Tax=Intoshia linei TaxID=1819745 RepID=A0A177AXR9_9BILA|nr:hypothetical protein A3Q56_06070 [Intoshia linei]